MVNAACLKTYLLKYGSLSPYSRPRWTLRCRHTFESYEYGIAHQLDSSEFTGLTSVGLTEGMAGAWFLGMKLFA